MKYRYKYYSIFCILFFTANQLFSQGSAIDSISKPDRQFFIDGGFGMTIIKDNNSPGFFARMGVSTERFSVSLIGSAHYFFSDLDNSKKIVDGYAGLEFLGRKESTFLEGLIGDKHKKRSGLGLAYCFQNESKVDKKNPFKVYGIYYFGTIGFSVEYIWGDFFYPAIGIRIG